MSKYKYEWPYIQYLSNKDREEYTSDLPRDLNKLEVFHIVPSVRYHDNPYLLYRSNIWMCNSKSTLEFNFVV